MKIAPPRNEELFAPLPPMKVLLQNLVLLLRIEHFFIKVDNNHNT